MRNHTMRNALICLTTACIAAVPACIFGQSITWLGVLPGDDSSSAKAISSDGKFVVGYSVQQGEYHPFIWTRDDGLIALPRMTEYGSCVATDVTSTPDLIVCGYCNNQYSNSRPVRWVNYTLVPIDTSRYPYGKAWAISPTGRIAGEVEIPNGNPRAVYWDEQGVMEDIIPIAWSEFTNRVYSCLPYTQEDYLCADENSQWTGNTRLKNSTHTTNKNATSTSPNASKPSSCSDAAHPPDKSPASWASRECPFTSGSLGIAQAGWMNSPVAHAGATEPRRVHA
jgi:uncharacterized membrane protein